MQPETITVPGRVQFECLPVPSDLQGYNYDGTPKSWTPVGFLSHPLFILIAIWPDEGFQRYESLHYILQHSLNSVWILEVSHWSAKGSSTMVLPSDSEKLWATAEIHTAWRLPILPVEVTVFFTWELLLIKQLSKQQRQAKAFLNSPKPLDPEWRLRNRLFTVDTAAWIYVLPNCF